MTSPDVGPGSAEEDPGTAPSGRRWWQGLVADVTPLRVSPEYRRLWVGESVSLIGNQMTTVVVGIQVYELTDSSAAVGLVGLCALVPLVALGLFGGALADRVERRRLALTTSSGLALLSLVLVAQAVAELRSTLLLYAVVALQSALFAVDSPTRRTFPPRLLPPDLIPAAMALSMVTMGIGLTLGPLIGGLVVDRFGYSAAYGLDSLTFVVALAALAQLRPMPPLREGTGRATVLEGLRLLKTRQVLLATFVADLIAMVFGMPRAVFPELADDVFGGGAATVGYLNAAIAAGTLLASALSGPASRYARQGVGILVAIGAWGLAITLFGLAQWLPLALLCLVAAGAADAVSAVWRNSVLQVATPDEYRGRLGGVFLVVVAGGPRLGDLRVGGMASLVGPGNAVVGGGLVVMAGAALMAPLFPRLVRYDARDPQH